MSAYKMGYVRVSPHDQNLDRQIEQLKAAGCHRIYKEIMAGTKNENPELKKMLGDLRTGDTIIITELTRLSRSRKELFAIAEQIERKGANIRSIKESWLDTTVPPGESVFAVFSGISQYERDLTRLGIQEGIASARSRGKKGGRPVKDKKAVDRAIEMYNSQMHSVSEIEKSTGVSRATLYRYIKKYI